MVNQAAKKNVWLIGCHKQKLDNKGRTTFPNAWQRKNSALPSVFNLSAREGKPYITGQYDSARRMTRRSTERHSKFNTTVGLDSSGRISLDKNMLEHIEAKPKDKIIVLGLFRYFEIWSAEAWENRKSNRKKTIVEKPAHNPNEPSAE